ncbi:MAG: hypothetical protein NTZ32_04865 [Planctomycetales bacterium]|nr:hypothetical protein [Planctomycetales bacterium]
MYANTFRLDLNKDLRADDVLANPPFSDSDWHRSDEVVRWKFVLSPSGFAGFVLANGSMSSNHWGMEMLISICKCAHDSALSPPVLRRIE